MEKTLISRQTLAARWDFDNPNSLIKYENEGVITRNTNFKAPRYYMEEIIQIEALKEINPLSPLERRKLEQKIESLEKELSLCKEKLNNIKIELSSL